MTVGSMSASRRAFSTPKWYRPEGRSDTQRRGAAGDGALQSIACAAGDWGWGGGGSRTNTFGGAKGKRVLEDRVPRPMWVRAGGGGGWHKASVSGGGGGCTGNAHTQTLGAKQVFVCPAHVHPTERHVAAGQGPPGLPRVTEASTRSSGKWDWEGGGGYFADMCLFVGGGGGGGDGLLVHESGAAVPLLKGAASASLPRASDSDASHSVGPVGIRTVPPTTEWRHRPRGAGAA